MLTQGTAPVIAETSAFRVLCDLRQVLHARADRRHVAATVVDVRATVAAAEKPRVLVGSLSTGVAIIVPLVVCLLLDLFPGTLHRASIGFPVFNRSVGTK